METIPHGRKTTAHYLLFVKWLFMRPLPGLPAACYARAILWELRANARGGPAPTFASENGESPRHEKQPTTNNQPSISMTTRKTLYTAVIILFVLFASRMRYQEKTRDRRVGPNHPVPAALTAGRATAPETRPGN